jgi:hypothetical protein
MAGQSMTYLSAGTMDGSTPALKFAAMDNWRVLALVLSIVAFFAPFDKPDALTGALTPNRIFEALFLIASAGISVTAFLLGKYTIRIRHTHVLYVAFFLLALSSALWSSRDAYSAQKAAQLILLFSPQSLWPAQA